MPTYDYLCDACNHQFEEFQSFSEKPLKKCPACKKPKLKRLLGTGAAILFKGTGFYQTDYRSDSYKAAAKADQTPPASTSSTDSGGSTGKSDTNGTGSNGSANKSEKSTKSNP